MKQSIFQELRDMAVVVADEFAAIQNLELDGPSIRLVRMSGEWHGLWLFNAVTVGGAFKELAVMMTPDPSGDVVRLMAPGIVRRVKLSAFKERVSDALAAKPKSQGQTVSDVCYENWQRAQGELAAHSAVIGGGATMPQSQKTG